MENDKGIFIKNIFYMLSYAFQVLQQENYEKVQSENFKDIEDLFADILARGISQQLKQGLYREYKNVEENLSTLRGKILIGETIKNKQNNKLKIYCEHDELTENNIFNQILKTSACYLIRSSKVNKKRKATLKKLMCYFENIEVLKITQSVWNRLVFKKNNQSYQMLMNLCYLLWNSLLQNQEDGEIKLADFVDKYMNKLFEKFVLNYYKKHYGKRLYVNASRVDWGIETGCEKLELLPTMNTDIMLSNDDSILIIDTKYYGKMVQARFDRDSYHSNNLYQIHTYVTNEQFNKKEQQVAGMLLYAKTDEKICIDGECIITNNKYYFRSLDLNCDFEKIKNQLDKIVEDYFGIGSCLNI